MDFHGWKSTFSYLIPTNGRVLEICVGGFDDLTMSFVGLGYDKLTMGVCGMLQVSIRDTC